MGAPPCATVKRSPTPGAILVSHSLAGIASVNDETPPFDVRRRGGATSVSRLGKPDGGSCSPRISSANATAHRPIKRSGEGGAALRPGDRPSLRRSTSTRDLSFLGCDDETPPRSLCGEGRGLMSSTASSREPYWFSQLPVRLERRNPARRRRITAPDRAFCATGSQWRTGGQVMALMIWMRSSVV